MPPFSLRFALYKGELLFVRPISVTKTGKLKKRHQGVFNPKHPAPYELSRGRIENFIRSPAKFWLEQAKGVEFPSMIPMNLNTNTDTLLKKDHDQYRGKGPTPLMKKAGLKHLRPFAHEDMEKWEKSLHFGLSPRHFNTLHKKTNILFGGGLDDVWENVKTGELHVVDYKSTAQLRTYSDGVTGTKTLETPISTGYSQYQQFLAKN